MLLIVSKFNIMLIQVYNSKVLRKKRHINLRIYKSKYVYAIKNLYKLLEKNNNIIIKFEFIDV